MVSLNQWQEWKNTAKHPKGHIRTLHLPCQETKKLELGNSTEKGGLRSQERNGS